MNRYTFRIDFNELDIDADKIGRLIGHRRGEDEDIISGIVEDALAEASRICDIRAEFVIPANVSVDVNGGMVHIGPLDFNVGKIVSSGLKNIQSAALFLCTAGNEISRMAVKLMEEKDFLPGYIFDVAGSEIVEAAADKMHLKLKEIADAEGKNITNRYSPGYCGWDVAEQHKLFSLMPDNYCGVRLTESALMVPVKSVSGIIGIGSNVKFRHYECLHCNALNCIYRREKELLWKRKTNEQQS